MSALAAAPNLLAVHRGRIWSTTLDLVVTDPGAVVEATRTLNAVLARVEEVASRFRPDSELNRLNGASGTGPVAITPDLLEALGHALDAAADTDGAVDPTVGDALLRLGYDTDFEAMDPDQDGPVPPAGPVPGWTSVHLDRSESTVALDPGVRLDLGATAKAWAADRAATAVATRCGCGVLVSLGGDVAVAGPPPPGGFAVGVSDRCDDPTPQTTVAVGVGGLATSGMGRRTWRRGGRLVHHIVDPATGLPVEGPWRTVTVAASTCVTANTATTASMVTGERAVGWLEARGASARLVRHDGQVVLVGGWPGGDA